MFEVTKLFSQCAQDRKGKVERERVPFLVDQLKASSRSQSSRVERLSRRCKNTCKGILARPPWIRNPTEIGTARRQTRRWSLGAYHRWLYA